MAFHQQRQLRRPQNEWGGWTNGGTVYSVKMNGWRVLMARINKRLGCM